MISAGVGGGLGDQRLDDDLHGQARSRYGLPGGPSTAIVLVRPDGYVMGRWSGLDAAPVLSCLRDKGIRP